MTIRAFLRLWSDLLPYRPAWPAERPIRFVTSFDERLYEASGRRCVESMRRHNPHYRLVCYAEAGSAAAFERMRAEIEALGGEVVDLAAVPLLGAFLESARDVIPAEFGGTAPELLFPASGPGSRDVWFRRHMARWFRKVAALDHAASAEGGVLVWIDCDAYASAPLPRLALERAFRGAGVFHMKGNRKYTEMGLVGFDLDQEGVRAFLADLRDHYVQGRFRAHARWDDCYAFDLLRAGRRVPRFRDIGGVAVRRSHILCNTPLGAYLEHDKGLHQRQFFRGDRRPEAGPAAARQADDPGSEQASRLSLDEPAHRS